jgi:hypothetical protein
MKNSWFLIFTVLFIIGTVLKIILRLNMLDISMIPRDFRYFISVLWYGMLAVSLIKSHNIRKHS